MIRIRYPCSDEGASLILALVFLSLFGLFIAALLALGASSELVSGSVQNQGKEIYAADGAVQAAINYIRPIVTQGVDPGQGGTCNAPTVTVNGKSPSVTCQGLPGSGAISGGGINNDLDTPKYAILTLSTSSAEDGLNVAISGSGNKFAVSGSVYSDSDIVAGPGSMIVTGTITAGAYMGTTTGCSGTITAIPAAGKNCATTTAISDPGVTGTTQLAAWTPLVSAPPAAVATAPVCSSGRVTFAAGTYSDPALLAPATSCGTAVFSPGAYYFNFPSSNSSADLSGANIIGGTLTASQTTCNPMGAGVQFIFGGPSHFSGSNVKMTLCADRSLTKQQIAIYGVRATNAPPGFTPESGCVTTPGGCALISTTGSQTAIQVTGTAYVPSASLDLQITLNAEEIFYRGVIARSLILHQTGSAPSGVPNIFSPISVSSSPPTVANRLVQFIAKLNGNTVLTAVVAYDDSSGGPGKNVVVQSWSVDR